jgi:hypothetical protein
MQQTFGLHRAPVNRHPGFKKIISDFRKFYTQMIHHRITHKPLQISDSWTYKPD